LNKYVKWALGILGTILLGAIGSGVWEWILADLFSWLGNSFISIASTFSKVYVDSLYKDIWKGAEYSYLREIYVITFVIYLMLPLIILRIRIRKPNKKTDTNNKAQKKFILGVLIAALIFTLTIKIWETNYTVDTAKTLIANISILAPNIDPEEIKILKSEFNMVKDREAVHSLKDKIDKLSNDNQIKIHDMDFL